MSREQSHALQQEIDRLVGGDLSRTEMRRFVEQLDATPDAWKHCALAFVEAQLWKQTMRSLLPAEAEPVSEPVAPVRSRGRALLAVAAVCSFAIGIGVALAWSGHDERSIATGVVDGPMTRWRPDERVIDKSAGKRQSGVVGVVRVSNDGMTETAFNLVRTSGNQFSSVALTSTAPTAYDAEVLQSRGYHIEKHRKIVSVQLADGKQFQIPVDWVNYRYVGQAVY